MTFYNVPGFSFKVFWTFFLLSWSNLDQRSPVIQYLEFKSRPVGELDFVVKFIWFIIFSVVSGLAIGSFSGLPTSPLEKALFIFEASFAVLVILIFTATPLLYVYLGIALFSALLAVQIVLVSVVIVLHVIAHIHRNETGVFFSNADDTIGAIVVLVLFESLYLFSHLSWERSEKRRLHYVQSKIIQARQFRCKRPRANF